MLRRAMLSASPPNFFAIPFGLAGLAVVWRAMDDYHGAPRIIADLLFLAAALVWLVLLYGMVLRARSGWRAFVALISDPVFSPFCSLPPIVGMLLAIGLQPHAEGVAKALFIIFAVITLLFGGWVTGQWIIDDMDESKINPGYFLPTVAGGLITATVAAGFGYEGFGWFCFGLGMLCWFALGSIVLNRLFLAARLPAPLLPTMAIEVAPPAVAGNAYFALHGLHADTFAYGLAGYAFLMVLVQLRLISLYRQLSFSPGFWAFTFSYSAVAAFGLRWLALEHPSGEALWSWLVTGAATLMVAAIAVRSAGLLRRGAFFPRPPAPPAPEPQPAAAV
jgi:tellurite resistance protein